MDYLGILFFKIRDAVLRYKHYFTQVEALENAFT